MNRSHQNGLIFQLALAVRRLLVKVEHRSPDARFAEKAVRKADKALRKR